MTKRDKREERIRNNPKVVTFEELDWLLRQYGFVEVRRTGSHAAYRHPDQAIGSGYIKPIPYRRPYLLTCYVKDVLEMLDALSGEE